MSTERDLIDALRAFASIQIDCPTEIVPNGYANPVSWRSDVLKARAVLKAAESAVSSPAGDAAQRYSLQQSAGYKWLAHMIKDPAGEWVKFNAAAPAAPAQQSNSVTQDFRTTDLIPAAPVAEPHPDTVLLDWLIERRDIFAYHGRGLTIVACAGSFAAREIETSDVRTAIKVAMQQHLPTPEVAPK